jgi:Transposase DDE domain group 1
MSELNAFLPGLSPVAGKPLTTNRDAGNLSSNGGLVVLREAALRLDIAAVIAGPLPDKRNQLLITHTYSEMVLARMMMIAAGHEDCDDIDRLKIDPALKLACGRAPESGDDLMSQPTLSRLENLADTKALLKIGRAMIDLFCRSYETPPRSIDLDIDDTDDMVHGGQQLALFNTHAGGHCFKPMYIFEAASGKPVLALLRPGKRPAGTEIARVLRHVIMRVRKHWPGVGIMIRGDGHYCAPEVLNLLRKMNCKYMIGVPTNAVLDVTSAPWRQQCQNRWKPARPKVRRFHQFQYAAGTWSHKEKVIARNEATALGTDTRYVVTNLEGRGKHLYEHVYCARGRMENLIKDMKLYTRSDKTACHRWQANQFRLFLHMGAYWLLHSVRLAAPRKSRWRGATFETIRTLLVKVAVRVEELKSRIKLSFPASLPHGPDLDMITARLTALRL